MKKSFYHLRKKVAILGAVAICVLLFSDQSFGQGVSINATGTGTSPDASAILDLNITSKGFLVPRMTQAQRNAITSPATSLLIFQTDNTPGFYYNSGTPGTPVWTTFGGGSGPTAGNDIDVTGTQVDIEPVLDFVHTVNGAAGNPLTLTAPASNDLVFGAGGSERGRFLSAGGLRVGVPSAAAGSIIFANATNGNTVTLNSGATTTSYTLTLPLVQGAANTALMNNGSGTLTWATPASTLTAGSGIDITGSTISNTGVLSFSASGTGLTPSSATNGAVTLAGTLDVDNGGTGATTLTGMLKGNGTSPVTGVTGTQWGAAYWSDANTVASTAAGTSGQLLVSGGSGAPTWSNNIPAGDADYIQNQNTAAQATSNFWISGRGTFGTAGARFLESAGNTYYTTILAGDQSADLTLTLPVDAGTNGQVLRTNGSGALSWITPLTNPMDQVGDMIIGGASGAATQLNPAAGVLHNTVGGAVSWAPVNMAGGATEVSGILPVGNGGTGVANPTANGILVGAGTSAVTSLTGTTMQTIRFNSSGVPVANNQILNDGTKVGIGLTTADVTASTSQLDIFGDNTNTLSLQIRGGDIQSANADHTTYSSQIAFGFNGTANYRHSIRTRHNSSVGTSNAIDFYLWNPGVDAAGTIGSNNVFSIFNNGSGSQGIIVNGAFMPGGTAGTAGQVLTSGGTGVNPVWVNSSTLMPGGFSGFANPSVTIGLTATNGTATTAMRSDAAPALSQAIVPTWTGAHTFSANATFNALALIANGTVAAPSLAFTNSTGTGIYRPAADQLGITVAGSQKMIATANGVGVNGGVATATNALVVTGKVKSTGINETSDARLKKNFASIDGALDRVLSMSGKFYDWRVSEFPDKGLEEGRQVGVIAQEIEKILPEVVVTDDDGFKSVEYGHIVPVLIEAIKEQQKIIDGQNTTITNLKASLDNVLNKVNIIERNVDLNNSKVDK